MWPSLGVISYQQSLVGDTLSKQLSLTLNLKEKRLVSELYLFCKSVGSLSKQGRVSWLSIQTLELGKSGFQSQLCHLLSG